MKRPILCGVGLGILSPLTLLLFTYALAAVTFLPVRDYLPIAALTGFLIAAGAGAIFAALFSHFARPRYGAAFLAWVFSALAFEYLYVLLGPSPDEIYYRLSGCEYHLGGGGGFAYMLSLVAFFVVFFASFLLFYCLFTTLFRPGKKE